MKSESYINYAKQVADGSIVSGRLMVLAARRFLGDLNDPRFTFNEKKVARAIRFIGEMRHFTGKSSGKPFVLEPWQAFVVANIVGFYWAGTDNRRFSSSYIEVARKNGKSSLAAALCLYFLVADGEDGAEVLLCANAKDQAKISFDMCRNYVSTVPNSWEVLRCLHNEIKLDATKSRLKVLAADDSKLDGFNCSFGLIDEYHAAKNSRVRDVIKSSMGMRQNPHLCTITTAGFDKMLPCYALRTTAVEILNGIKHDDEMFIAIYSLDDDDDWTDEAVWAKANPNLDVTVTTKYIRGQVQQAKNNPSEEVSTITKNLNRWMETAEVWVPEHYIQEASRDFGASDFGSDDICYVGVDLGSTSDLTAVAKMVVRDGIYWFWIDYYCPELAMVERAEKEQYRFWKRQGMLHVTGGNVTDYDAITADLLALSDKLSVYGVGYDKWNATQWAIDCTEKGLPLCEYSQSIGNFNKPTKELERLLLGGRIRIANNDITRFCFANVRLKYDHNGNCKPDKGEYKRKIDGVIAMITALGVYLDTPHYEQMIYTTNT